MSWKPKRWLRQVLAGWIPYCRPSNSVTAQKGSWYTDANQTKSHTGSHPSLIHKLPMKITNGNNARSSTRVHQCQYTNYKPDNIVQCNITHTTTVTASSSASTAIFQLVNLSWLVPPQLLPPTDPVAHASLWKGCHYCQCLAVPSYTQTYIPTESIRTCIMLNLTWVARSAEHSLQSAAVPHCLYLHLLQQPTYSIALPCFKPQLLQRQQ